MANAAGVKVEGLRELRKSIAHLPEVKTRLRQDLLDIGRKIVTDAQAAVPVSGKSVAKYIRTTKSGRPDRRFKPGSTTTKGGAARESIRTGVSGNNAYIAGGKATVPYYGWLDFGSRKPRSGQPRTVGPWKKTGAGPKKGRFIYPAIDRNAKNIKKAALKAFDRVERER